MKYKCLNSSRWGSHSILSITMQLHPPSHIHDPEHAKMTRNFLWKLDYHVLPPLALVRSIAMVSRSWCLKVMISCGLLISSIEVTWEMRGQSNYWVPGVSSSILI